MSVPQPSKKPVVFIDGETGTPGLGIAEHLISALAAIAVRSIAPGSTPPVLRIPKGRDRVWLQRMPDEKDSAAIAIVLGIRVPRVGQRVGHARLRSSEPSSPKALDQGHFSRVTVNIVGDGDRKHSARRNGEVYGP
jgi:hypothetical protein